MNLGLFVLLFFLALPSWAAGPVQLFSAPGVQVDGYGGIVWTLKAGDQIRFSDGKVFKVKKILGKGDTTMVLETSDGNALRIPIRSGIYDGGSIDVEDIHYTDFIDEYLNGAKNLNHFGVETPKIYSSLKSEYVEVEKIGKPEKNIRLDQFIHGQVHLSSEKEKQMHARLLEWAKQFWAVSEIGDFKEEQVLYDGKRWILIDFMNHVQGVSSITQREDVFSGAEGGIYDELHSVIQNERVLRMGAKLSRSSCIKASLKGLKTGVSKL